MPKKRRDLTPQELARAARLKAIFNQAKKDFYGPKRHLSQEKAAHELGWKGQSAVEQYTSGRVALPFDAGLKFSELLNVPLSKIEPEWAARVATASVPETGADFSDFVAVDHYDVAFAAGDGRQTEHEAPSALFFRRDWLSSHGFIARQLTVVNGAGDSMSPTIRDGDALLVNRQDRHIKSERVYAFIQNNETRVKRLLWRYDGSLIIHSDNDAGQYPDEIVPPCDLEFISLIGRVVWRAGTVS